MGYCGLIMDWRRPSIRRGAAVFASCLLVVIGACREPSDQRNLPYRISAVGWAPDGRVVVATSQVDQAARLWMMQSEKELRPLLFEYCNPIVVLSVFPLRSTRQIGLAVWCADPPSYRVVSLDLFDLHVDVLATVSSAIDSGYWSEATAIAYVEYGENGCAGIGDVGPAGLRPLALRLAFEGVSIALESYLPPPGGTCTARALARRPAVSANGRYLAFFLRVCDAGCSGQKEFDRYWHVVTNDLSDGRVDVSSSLFTSPHGLAISNNGSLAISAGHDGATGVWQCDSYACGTPRQLAAGSFASPAFDGDGKRIVAAESGHSYPRYITLG